MDEQKQDAPEVLETPDTVEETVIEETQETAAEETPQTDEEKETLRKEVEDLKKKNAQLFERVKKQKEAPSNDLSNKDVLVLAKANLSPDDIDEVVEYAKFKKIAVAEALKMPVITTLLAEREEERRTASATQVRGGARGTSKVSGEDILSRAERTGEVPDSDEGMTELFKARLARRIPSKT